MASADPAPTAILAPGYWLGGRARDEVIDRLAQMGSAAAAVTLPGLESASASRAGVRFADHVDALLAAIRDAQRPVVPGVPSGGDAEACHG